MLRINDVRRPSTYSIVFANEEKLILAINASGLFRAQLVKANELAERQVLFEWPRSSARSNAKSMFDRLFYRTFYWWALSIVLSNVLG